VAGRRDRPGRVPESLSLLGGECCEQRRLGALACLTRPPDGVPSLDAATLVALSAIADRYDLAGVLWVGQVIRGF
jgi:hypothetical protein